MDKPSPSSVDLSYRAYLQFVICVMVVVSFFYLNIYIYIAPFYRHCRQSTQKYWLFVERLSLIYRTVDRKNSRRIGTPWEWMPPILIHCYRHFSIYVCCSCFKSTFFILHVAVDAICPLGEAFTSAEVYVFFSGFLLLFFFFFFRWEVYATDIWGQLHILKRSTWGHHSVLYILPIWLNSPPPL